MADAELRRLERRQGAGLDDEVAWLRGLLRTGRLDDRRLRLAAHLGSASACALVGRAAPTARDDQEEGMFDGLEAFGLEACARVVLAFADELRPLVPDDHAEAPLLRDGLAAVRAWLACPCARHAGLLSPHPGELYMAAHERCAKDGPRFAALMVAALACHTIALPEQVEGWLPSGEHFARMAATPAALRAAVLRDVLPWALTAPAPSPAPSDAELRARWRAGDVDAGAAWLQGVSRRADDDDQVARRIELAALLGEPAAVMATGSTDAPFVPDELSSNDHGELGARLALAAARAVAGELPVGASTLAAVEAWLACPCDAHRDALQVVHDALPSATEGPVGCLRVATRWCRAREAPPPPPEPELELELELDDEAFAEQAARKAARLLARHRDPHAKVDSMPPAGAMGHAARHAVILAAGLLGPEPLRAALRRELVPWLLDLGGE